MSSGSSSMSSEEPPSLGSDGVRLPSSSPESLSMPRLCESMAHRLSAGNRLCSVAQWPWQAPFDQPLTAVTVRVPSVDAGQYGQRRGVADPPVIRPV